MGIIAAFRHGRYGRALTPAPLPHSGEGKALGEKVRTNCAAIALFSRFREKGAMRYRGFTYFDKLIPLRISVP